MKKCLRLFVVIYNHVSSPYVLLLAGSRSEGENSLTLFVVVLHTCDQIKCQNSVIRIKVSSPYVLPLAGFSGEEVKVP